MYVYKRIDFAGSSDGSCKGSSSEASRGGGRCNFHCEHFFFYHFNLCAMSLYYLVEMNF